MRNIAKLRTNFMQTSSGSQHKVFPWPQTPPSPDSHFTPPNGSSFDKFLRYQRRRFTVESSLTGWDCRLCRQMKPFPFTSIVISMARRSHNVFVCHKKTTILFGIRSLRRYIKQTQTNFRRQILASNRSKVSTERPRSSIHDVRWWCDNNSAVWHIKLKTKTNSQIVQCKRQFNAMTAG